MLIYAHNINLFLCTSDLHTLFSSLSTVECLDCGKDAVTISLINSLSDCNSLTPVICWISLGNLEHKSESEKIAGMFPTFELVWN